MKREFVCCALALLGFGAAQAQTPADSLLLELENISAFEEGSALQKSLNSEFKAGAIAGMSSREVPNIVSFISANDIRNTGARDLIDVLRLVPGFDFGTDVETVVGPSLRGNWAMEGKILMLIDGIEMNELLFQSLKFGSHFPVDLIERIEVIRGPGSAIYGGTAEYGVINIITKGKEGPEGLNIYTSYGQLDNIYGRRQAGISLRKTIQGSTLDMTGSIGEGNRSEENYRSFRGDPVNLNSTRSAYVQPSYLNVGLQSGNFEVRALYDNYRWRTFLYEIENKQFSTYAAYRLKLGETTTLSPKISYTNQLPWHYTDQYSSNEDDWYEYQIRAQRLMGTLTLDHRFTRRLRLSSGLETQYQHARDMLFEEGLEGNFGDVPDMDFMNYSLFSQLFWKNYFANLTAGLRYEYRPGLGGAIVPRFAATKHIDKWHVKLLYSHAYRMPGIENMNLAIGTLRPESSRVAEAELGYQFTKDMMLSLNAFRMGVQDIIVYGYNVLTLEESYVNEALTGTKGLEANFQLQQPRWRTQLGYSFYRPIRGNSVEDYQVEDNNRLFLGMPAHKLSFNGTVDITRKLHLNTTAIWHSERYGYTGFADAEQQEYLLERFDPYLLLNVFLRYEHVFRNLHLGVGAYNLLNTQYRYIQPYAGENTPFPNSGKELIFKLQYEIPFRK